jgi:hypothetical protein
MNQNIHNDALALQDLREYETNIIDTLKVIYPWKVLIGALTLPYHGMKVLGVFVVKNELMSG